MDFGKFFRDKINSIRLEIARQGSTSDVSEFHFVLDGSSFSEFRLLSETEVHELIKLSTKTTCSLDPILTKLFTECLDVLPPPITKLINLSLESGYFPLIWKRALLNHCYRRRVSTSSLRTLDLWVTSHMPQNFVETAVAYQLQHYLFSNDLFPCSAISLSSQTQHRNSTSQSHSASSPQLKCSFWHCRSRHFTASTSVQIWYKWKSPLLVFVLPVWKVSAKSHQRRHSPPNSSCNVMSLKVPVWAPYYLLCIRAISSRSSNTIFLRFIVTLTTRRYTSHSAQTTGSINLMLESYWKVALLTFVLGCCMTILN